MDDYDRMANRQEARVDSHHVTSPPSPQIQAVGLGAQIVTLGALRATEAIAWTSIFPYVYFMIQSFNEVDESMIPFYAGLLVAVFTFCEFLSGMVWARVSDDIGRKTTLLFGSICGIATTLVFGTSRSMLQAAIARTLGGFLNPNVGLVQTCVVEFANTKEQRTKALSWVSFIRSMGNLIGPVLGGILADPSALYPNVFPPDSLWGKYKYLLPNLAVVLLQFITLGAVFLLLEETNPKLAVTPDLGLRTRHLLQSYLGIKPVDNKGGNYVPINTRESDANPGSSTATHEEDEHELQEIKTATSTNENSLDERLPNSAFTAQVILQILSVSLLAFHKVSSDAIMPTFLAAPVATAAPEETFHRGAFGGSNGFNYSGQKIGLILLSQAIFGLCIQAAIVPLFINRLGTLKAYRIVLGIYPLAYLFTPLLPNLEEPLALGTVTLDLWIKVALSSVGYICSAVLISDITPRSEFLARVNGASASFSCFARSLGPLVTGKLFAVGLNVGYVGIAFWALSAVASAGAVESWFLRDHI
ncbi:major facilitator superfamily domain-containing protein [Xylaria longipes]|nr:major facilitator superfamily domain-containing protein [Xylaria longipes]